MRAEFLPLWESSEIDWLIVEISGLGFRPLIDLLIVSTTRVESSVHV
jgi:hypothetical protein